MNNWLIVRWPALARFWSLFVLAGWYLAVGVVTRLSLWWSFGRATNVGAESLLWMVPAGLVSDAVQALYFLTFMALLRWFTPDRWYRSKIGQWIGLAGVYLWMFALLFVAFIEYFFFEEFNARFNLVSVDYLLYPTEVVGDIWAVYPVVAVLVYCGILALVSVLILYRPLISARHYQTNMKQRTRIIAGLGTLIGVSVPALSTDTFAYSENRVANELAANGASSFFRALRTNEIDYHTYYATRPPDENLQRLTAQLSREGGEFTRLGEGRLDRRFDAKKDALGKLNVVVIASEAFGAEFSKLYGSQRNWTPEFDSIAQKGLWFRNTYASGTRTVRGLEAITASFPPIPSNSIVRRPGNENIATWGKVMSENGYRTSFLYGGYGYFDNMNYFYSRNGFDVRDRQSVEHATRFENIWGVADEDLFDMALEYYDAAAGGDSPFFSIIMTTSNHKPFTFRDGVSGVKAKGGGREAGVRYADFALGYFLREAEKRTSWFDNTIFIIVADHGARVYGKQDIPLKTYEIPLVVYAPRHVSPRRVDTLTTQIDIAPTVLGLLGFGYTAPFFGQDVLNTAEKNRIAFFSHNYDVALYRDGELAILGLKKTIKNVFYDRETDTYRDAPLNPELNDLAIAYYQTAYELFRADKYE